MKNLRILIRPALPKIFLAAVIGGISMAMAVGLLACSSWLISMASLRPPILVLEVAIVAVRFFGLSRGALRYLSRLIEHNSALETLNEIRIRLYLSIERQLPQYFSIFHRGEVLRKLISDGEVLQDLWLRIFNPWLGAVISGSAGLGIIFYLLPALGLVLSLIFISAMLFVPMISVLLSASENQRSEEALVFDSIVQASDSVQESLVFGYQRLVRTQIETSQQKLNRIDIRSGIAVGFSIFIQNLLTGISVIIAAWLAIPAFGANDLAGVNVAVVVLLPLVIFDGLSGLPAAFSRLATVINSAKSVEELLDQRTESAKYSVALIPQSDLRIDFHSVIALVPGRSLQPFSGRAKPGKPLIISGKSGLGKSSLIHALLGFLDYKGNLEINGQEARLLSSEERISHFSVLLQNDHLFATSIRENLKIGDIDAQDSDLLEVLEIVELADLIREIGLDTHIQAYGYNFSGGEKQRMKLARTLLRDKPVVILDEPFEYLDINQARRISTRVFDHCKEKTLIIVSHLPLQPFK